MKTALPGFACILIFISILSGCSPQPPMPTVPFVDLQRFMGDWYVIANIPTFIEEGAHDAVENYRLAEDGTVATTFTFLADSFDGEKKTYSPTGFVSDTYSNAVWEMQFIWPFKADYRIVYLDQDYRRTIIARKARDYVWIMSRTPTLTEAELKEMIRFVKELGYDETAVKTVPQRTEGRDAG